MNTLRKFTEQESATIRRNMKMINDWIESDIFPRLRSKVVFYIDDKRSAYIEINPFCDLHSKICCYSGYYRTHRLYQTEFNNKGDCMEYDCIAYEVLAHWPNLRESILREVKEQNDTEWLNTFTID